MPSNKPKAHHAKVFICKCKSHCTTLNPSTGRYEGEGERVPQSTRDRHTRDNHVLATCKLPQPVNATLLGHPAESATSTQSIPIAWHSFSQTSIIPSIANYKASQNWIDLLEWEVDNHCHHPVTSPTIPLVFINDPLLQGEYIPPAPHELAQPNSGLYALVERKQANKAFLATEYRFFSRLFLRQARTFKSDYIKSLAARVVRKKSTGRSSGSTLIKGESLWIPVSHWTLLLFGYLDQTTLFRDPLLSTWSFWSDNKGCINHIPHYGRAFFFTTESALFTVGRFSRSAESSRGFWGYHQQGSKISFLDLPPIPPRYCLSSIYLLHEVPLHLSIQAWGYSCDPLLLHISKDTRECPM